MSDVCPISGETLKEERVNHLTHLAGFIFSVIGLLFLVVYTGLHADLKTILSASVYGSTLVMLYGASSYYHGCRSIQRKSKLRVVDHACIYLLIAGSYTPFTLGPLEDGCF
jgi:hemolysin III